MSRCLQETYEFMTIVISGNLIPLHMIIYKKKKSTGIYCSRMRVHEGVEEVHPVEKKWELNFAKEQYFQCNWKSTS